MFFIICFTNTKSKEICEEIFIPSSTYLLLRAIYFERWVPEAYLELSGKSTIDLFYENS